MTSYMEDAASERRMWRALTTAACGRVVYVTGTDEHDTNWMFKRCVAALENSGLDGTVWSARKANGNRAIRFENGGEVRFVSHQSQRLRGTRAGTAVMDEWA